MTTEGVRWHFIPPDSPHFGGLWEAGIKSMKHHMRRVIGNACLSFEEMFTILIQIEACLNSRPLCQISFDPRNTQALTPGHFLIGGILMVFLDTDFSSIPMNSYPAGNLCNGAPSIYGRNGPGIIYTSCNSVISGLHSPAISRVEEWFS